MAEQAEQPGPAGREATLWLDVYHRERAIAERRAATRAADIRARAAHLELAYQHDLAQAIAWHRADVGFDPAAALKALSRK